MRTRGWPTPQLRSELGTAQRLPAGRRAGQGSASPMSHPWAPHGARTQQVQADDVGDGAAGGQMRGTPLCGCVASPRSAFPSWVE